MPQAMGAGSQSLSSLLVVVAAAVARHVFSRRRGCRGAASRAPVRDPFLGLDFLYDCVFGGPEDTYLAPALDAFGRLGATYTVKRWSWEVIYTADGRNIRHLLAGGFDDFALPRLRGAAVGALLGRGIFTLDGPAWARASAALKLMLARVDRQAVVAALEPHFQALLGRVAPAGPVDLQSLFFRLAMDFAAHHLTGDPPADHDDRADRDYAACSGEVVRKLRLGPLQHLRFSPADFLAKRRVFRFVDRFIDRALALDDGLPPAEAASCASWRPRRRTARRCGTRCCTWSPAATPPPAS